MWSHLKARREAREFWEPRIEVLEDEITRLGKEIHHRQRELGKRQVELNRIKEAIALGRQSLVHRQKWQSPPARWNP